MAEPVVVYTDGACLGNPGPGGWAAVLAYGGREKQLSGGEVQTTNNRMELMAAIQALEALTRPVEVHVYSDSQYVKNGITDWLPKWRAKNWKTASNKPVKNAELWQRLEAAAAPHDVHWHWVRGHSGEAGNERVDDLARAAAEARRG